MQSLSVIHLSIIHPPIHQPVNLFISLSTQLSTNLQPTHLFPITPIPYPSIHLPTYPLAHLPHPYPFTPSLLTHPPIYASVYIYALTPDPSICSPTHPPATITSALPTITLSPKYLPSEQRPAPSSCLTLCPFSYCLTALVSVHSV